MASLAGAYGSVLITSSPNVALTNDVLTDAGDHKTFSEATSSKRYWDRTATFVVQTSPDGATWTTQTSGFTIRYVTGQVAFTNAVSGGTPGCRISSGAYLPYSTFGNMKLWEANVSTDMVDVTTFVGNGGAPWKQYIPTLVGGDLKADQFYADNTFISIISNATLFVFSGLTGRTATERYEGYARLKSDGIKVDVKSAIEESLNMNLDGPIYYFS